jgi:predicted RecB family nuclease
MYHYSQYERNELTKLAERHRCNQKLFERLFRNSTDLYQDVVDKHTEWPSPSYSIKAISGILGFHYSDPEPGGLKAAKWYAAYVGDPAGNAELKRKLLQYNEEDCLAMVVLKDWVVAESKKMNRQGELVF